MTEIITEVIFVACLLFLIGIFGIILNNKSLIHMLMSIELMLLATNLFLVTFSVSNDDIMGEVLALLVLGVAGAESAIGLAILVAYYRKKGTLSLSRS
jgi:NADH-quinone oxidoreductase subunit K